MYQIWIKIRGSWEPTQDIGTPIELERVLATWLSLYRRDHVWLAPVED
jgi:hypothetical protein